jgi:hypothetical protein
LLAAVIVAVSTWALGAVDGLMARWDFDEHASAPIVRDLSGNGNDATIRGPQYAPAGKGACLCFDGIDDYVDCGKPTLQIADRISVTAWLRPERPPAGEAGIVGRGASFDANWGLTYSDGARCYFYLSGGANNCSAELAPGSWHHVAATYDRSKLRVYIDGKEAASKPLDITTINDQGELLLGKNGRAHFKGVIDDVRLYNQSLAPEAIRREYDLGIDLRAGLAARPPLVEPVRVSDKVKSVRIGRCGAMEVEVAGEIYRFTSAFSYPGKPAGRNVLSDEAGESQKRWIPAVTREGETHLRVVATGEHYALTRDVILDGHRVHVDDTLTNLTDAPVGILIDHVVVGSRRFVDVLLSGGNVPSVRSVAENPSIFLSQQLSSVGALAEDNLFRLQFEAAASDRQATFGVRHFALDARARHTFRWTIYPFANRADYFDFVNSIRRNWNANYTLHGPFDWINVAARADFLEDTERLKAHLARRKLKIVGLLPYLGYFSGAPLSRDQYKTLMQMANKALKRADPDIWCVGSVENNIVAYERAKLSRSSILDDACRGTGEYPLALGEAQTRLLFNELPWKDSLVLDAQGRAMIEDCKPVEFVHPMVYSAPGNYHTSYLLDQAKFLIEDVGLDGVYMDHFNMTFEDRQRYDHSKWDGTTVDIDAANGEIIRKYTDAGLVGIKPREQLGRFILSRGKAFVVNTQNVANETQAMPIMHFEEVGSNADLGAMTPGQEPPLVQYIAKLQLGSPIGLGLPSSNKADPQTQHIDEVIKTAILYLRHGLLYYHNQTLVPQSGPGSGEYGPINHMFPITPVELHKGWIVGKERIVTAVSGTFAWSGQSKPRILRFDQCGREAEPNSAVTGSAGSWQVKLILTDWQEIAVIE